jgi:hypothetical protein
LKQLSASVEVESVIGAVKHKQARL